MPQARPQLLYIVHRVPFPPDKGDRIRAYNLARHFAQHADIHLACLADEPVPAETEEVLGRLCKRLAIHSIDRWSRRLGLMASLVRGGTATEGAFASSALRSTIRAWAQETRFDAVLASASSMVPYVRTPELHGVPSVIDLVDVDSQKWLEYALTRRGPMAWFYRLENRRLRRLEEGLTTWTRAVTLVSETEANIYRQFCKPGMVKAIRNGVDLDYYQPRPTANENGCVFVGAFDYHPNVDGACWFGHEIWAEIIHRRPSTTLSLVGRRPAWAVRDLARIPGINVVGQVPDVRPYIADSAVAVVPLRIARGVQNKVLEAMAMAKAVVASPQALEGIEAIPGEHLLTASTRAEWAEAIVHLHENPAHRQRLGSAARRFVEAHHRWANCLEPMSELLGIGPVHANGSHASSNDQR